jgi:hypothetical protein
MDDQLTISLSRAEALVLEAFLETFEHAPAFDALDRADQMAINGLHAALEREMADLFNPNYDRLLVQAQAIIRGEIDE